MALANVAADLLARGHCVLMVDFDLEAPGLDTFPIEVERPLANGLVDLIHDYLGKGEVPEIAGYVHKAKIKGVETGTLWLMPAGRQDKDYDARFKSIDWQDFYENQDGFLFFEDVKLQWQESLSPDYVLIDSRTGHTDIGGICTRQLPDCVIITFYPNEQNIRGLKPIVDDIRKEKDGPLRKRIELQFVMANVPDLDDEDQILAVAVAASQKALGYSELTATIHHYNSLMMLEQRLLIADRPRSKIANEYRQLVSAIVLKNPEDKQGAMTLLEQALSSVTTERASPIDPSTEELLERIRLKHPKDPKILRTLAKIRRVQVRMDEALSLLNQILEYDPVDSESLFARAEILTVLRQNERALEDLRRFFLLEDVQQVSFGLAVKLRLFLDQDRATEISESPMVTRLSAQVIDGVISDFQRRPRTVSAAVPLAHRWMMGNPDGQLFNMVRLRYRLALIGAGLFEEAVIEIMAGRSFSELSIEDSFNCAMAEWGRSRTLPADMFKKVITQFGDDTEMNANHLQCCSIANWAAGNGDRAAQLLDQASDRIKNAPRPSFSCWSYLERSPEQFRTDLGKMKRLYGGEDIAPAFIERSHVAPLEGG